MADEKKLDINPHEWVCVYPVYLDGTRSMRLGRKLPKAQCCEGLPNAQALAVVVHQIPLPFILEGNKAHPRDTWVRGRLRVKLWQDQPNDNVPRVPINPNFTSRRDLLVHLGKEVQVMKAKMDEAAALAAAARAAEMGGEDTPADKAASKAAAKAAKKKDKKTKKR
eukprot:TRINITY_DN9013_c0_g2_i1.p2 TRINITY_DN9013_c0_g2~~TRINITY_DN9013_c0_g2_i1.p2  ORF type:complete len:180 (-),score=38.21 TRINITY_DN9013_c0_g2_i1:20-517(-)